MEGIPMPRPYLAHALTAAALAVSLPGAAPASTLDPLALYGPELTFSVQRNGQMVGRHTVSFERDQAGRLSVESRMQLEIPFLLGLVAYRFRYESDAQWRDGALQRIRVAVDDDGKARKVDLAWSGTEFEGQVNGTPARMPGPLFPTDHWNRQAVGAPNVLNTLTGRLAEVAVTEHGVEQVDTAHGPITATRFEYTGDFRSEVWYDSEGRWVKLRFQGKDGSTIIYRCEICRAEALHVPQVAG